ARDRLCLYRNGLFVDVEERDGRALRREQFCGRRADSAGAAGDDRDLAGEGEQFRRAELGLLQRQVLAVEHVVFADRGESAGCFRVGDRLDRRLGEVGGDLRVLLRAAETVEADARNQRDTRRRIEHRAAAADTSVLPREIGFVVRDEV